MYLAIGTVIAAFAAHDQLEFLLLYSVIIVLQMLQKSNFKLILFSTIFVVCSYFIFVQTIPHSIAHGQKILTIRWTNQAKIDGQYVKGIAETTTGQRLYVRYKIPTETQKDSLQFIHLSAFQWTFEGAIIPPSPPAHLYTFSMEQYLRMNGASGVFEAERLVQMQPYHSISTMLSQWRSALQKQIDTYFPPPLQAEAKALLLGDRSDFDPALEREYQTLGITHLFAISGLHVGLITLLVWNILLRIGIRVETVRLILFIFLPLYAVLAGAAPSVIRAVSTTLFMLLAASFKNRWRLDDVLAWSAILFVYAQPFIVYQPGFQLSYVAAFGLIYSSSSILQSQTVIGSLFSVTLVAQLILYPFLLFHFYEYSLSSFLMNLLYVPIFSFFILPTNLFFLLFSYPFPSIVSILLSIYEPIRIEFANFTTWLASFPSQLWVGGRISLWQMMCSFTSVCLFFLGCELKWRWRVRIGVLVLPILLIVGRPYVDSALYVTVLDVGQGDSIVIELPYRKAVYLIDTGGVLSFQTENWKTPSRRFEVGRSIVVPYLKGRGIQKIDRMILTHADADHVEGADEVLEEMKVKEIHLSQGSEDELMMQSLITLAQKQKIPLIFPSLGDYWIESSIKFSYLSPQADRPYEGNNSSLVLYVQTDRINFLFTGDLEAEGEVQLRSQYDHMEWGHLVLKAGHHGSRTSSTEPFIMQLKPSLTIFSAGRENRYGHPHPEVVERFQVHGLPTLSTAESGTITIKVVGQTYQVQTMR